jgi:hypothetical protein
MEKGRVRGGEGLLRRGEGCYSLSFGEGRVDLERWAVKREK